MRLPSAVGQNGHESPPKAWPNLQPWGSPLNEKLVLAEGTCHLPLQGLDPVLLQLLTFDTPSREFRVDNRNEAFCAPGNLVEQVFRQLNSFRNWVYEPNPCIFSYLEKALNPFMVTSAENLFIRTWLHELPPSPKSRILTSPPSQLTSWEQFLRVFWSAVS